MKGIVAFLNPIIWWVVGMITLAFSTIFYPFIADAVEGTRTQMAAGGISESSYWGLAWSLTSTRLIIFATGIFLILIGIGIKWLKRK
jgi:hypothetical protein